MTPNNNLYPLPFYTDLQKQSHRKDYAFGENLRFIFCPNKKILPFQFMRQTRANAIASVLLKSIDGITIADILTQLQSNGLVVNDYSDCDVIQYPGKLLITTDTPEGPYYLEISDGVETWYSEVFTVVNDLSNYIRLSYKDSEDLILETGRIDFSNAFEFVVYIPTQVGWPEYEFEEQVEKRDGKQFVEKQISEKIYKFKFTSPEFLLDALRIVRMMDTIEIVSRGEAYDVEQFLITPKWLDGGYVASVDAEFHCDTIIKKIGRVFVPAQNGDFNGDFNDDFL